MTKSKCGIREEQVKGKEKALFCELCEQWRHTSCDKVEEETYAALNEGNDKRLYWFCADCNLKAMKGIKVVICLEKRTMEIEAKMSKMEANIEKITNFISWRLYFFKGRQSSQQHCSVAGTQNYIESL